MFKRTENLKLTDLIMFSRIAFFVFFAISFSVVPLCLSTDCSWQSRKKLRYELFLNNQGMVSDVKYDYVNNNYDRYNCLSKFSFISLILIQ